MRRRRAVLRVTSLRPPEPIGVMARARATPVPRSSSGTFSSNRVPADAPGNSGRPPGGEGRGEGPGGDVEREGSIRYWLITSGSGGVKVSVPRSNGLSSGPAGTSTYSSRTATLIRVCSWSERGSEGSFS